MSWKNDYNIEREKTIFLTKIGCFFILVTLGLFMVLLLAWFSSSSKESQLKVSYSPNNKNSIEIVKEDDFPDPALKIKYDNNKSIMKTKIPDKITVEWKNDYEAIVILSKQGREPETVNINFEQ